MLSSPRSNLDCTDNLACEAFHLLGAGQLSILRCGKPVQTSKVRIGSPCCLKEQYHLAAQPCQARLFPNRIVQALCLIRSGQLSLLVPVVDLELLEQGRLSSAVHSCCCYRSCCPSSVTVGGCIQEE